MALDPNEVISSTEKTKPDPNFPTRTIIITEITHRDGRIERGQRGQSDPPNAWVPLPGAVDDDVRKQFESDRKADLAQQKADEAAARAAKPDDSPKTITAADGSVWQYHPDEPDPQKKWQQVTPPKAEKPEPTPKPTVVAAAATDETRPTIVLSDGSTRPNPLYDPAAAKQALTKAEIDQKKAEIELRIKQGELDAAAGTREFDQWYKRRSLEHQQEADRLAREKAAADRSDKEREDVTAREKEGRRQAEAGLGFEYKAGRDAVADALALLPYQVGPTFGAEFGQALQTLSSGGGAIHPSASALTFQGPDLNAMAQAAADRAHQQWTAMGGSAAAQALATLPVAPPAGAPAPGYVPPAPVMPPSVGGNTGVVAPVTAANRDRYYA